MLTSNQSNIRVLIVDDHELTRFSLSLALQNQAGVELVGLASNGEEAIEMVKQYRPDVIVLDLQMPVMDGLSASAHIKSLHPNTKILAYSSLEDPQTEVMIQTAKIDAFRKKDTNTSELIALIQLLGRPTANHSSDN